MKKIVGLLAAAAVLATSVFAADVSAKVRVGGNIFSMDATKANKDGNEANTFSLLNADTVSHTYDAPFATLSTSTDNAGGTVKFVGDENGIKAGDVQVWFKPLDVLKIQAGSHDIAMNKETIDWTEHHGEQAYGTYGYSLGFAQDAISANVAFGTGDNGWFFQDAIGKYYTDKEPATSFINDLFVNFAYGADFGTISAFFRYRGKSWDGTAEAAKGDPSKLAFNPAQLNFGAAYKNTIDSLTFFVNLIASTKTAPAGDEEKAYWKYNDKNGNAYAPFGFGVDAFVQYSADALTVKGFVKYDTADFSHLNAKGDADLVDNGDNTLVEVLARVDYKLDNGIGLYAYFKDANLLTKKVQGTDTDPTSVFISTIKLGATGNVGIATWETWLQLDTGKQGAKDKKYNKVNVSMPCYIQVAF